MRCYYSVGAKYLVNSIISLCSRSIGSFIDLSSGMYQGVMSF
jgi:hypothetical protein